MAMTQTVLITRNLHSTAAASQIPKIEMALFKAFLRSPILRVTNRLCIKDSTTIYPVCGFDNFLIVSVK